MNKDIKITLPKSWNDLTDLQFEKICALLYSDISRKIIDAEIFKILAVSDQPTNKEKSDLFTVLQNVTIADLKQDFEFIYGKNTRTIFPKNITADGLTVFAPFDRISNLSANEFAAADDFHSKFRETKNTEFLYYLAATLYVLSQQPRPDFDKNNLEVLVPKFRNVPLAKLYAIELVYAGSKEHIVSKFKKAFPTSGKKSPKKFGFGKVILEMAGKKFGNHAETMKTNVYTFLAEFEENLNQKPQK